MGFAYKIRKVDPAMTFKIIKFDEQAFHPYDEQASYQPVRKMKLFGISNKTPTHSAVFRQIPTQILLLVLAKQPKN
uniref:Uncharacterized protein n=1 Tax=Nelumbo nucifera TaxID=4432 RepID=A0A822XHN0_NELNU|nr:TPA_asm: hypothetical protein HUJ06_021353 [Nelumbo nucifera]